MLRVFGLSGALTGRTDGKFAARAVNGHARSAQTSRRLCLRGAAAGCLCQAGRL